MEAPEFSFVAVIPTLRIFSVERAKEFYCGFLGFTLDWEHVFEPGMPVYMQVSRGGVKLHLSEHHGDGSPGVHIYVQMTGVDAYHREVTAKPYKYFRPKVEDAFYGARSMQVIDPFGNLIRFDEPKTAAEEK